ncbi:Hypothetical_protein [Hexamita inflata]|uniref:Hypothetical_protein n=1 Tax=Hexamita inflata TaxID=28002 RepID=A0AA86N947_9EUKA|nr:Hypothetical protein HINF_LOCUS2949 [Hexamita inflata]
MDLSFTILDVKTPRQPAICRSKQCGVDINSVQNITLIGCPFWRNFLRGLVLAYCRRDVSCAKMSCFGHEMKIDFGQVRQISFLVVCCDNDEAAQYTCKYTISEKLHLDILTNQFCMVPMRFFSILFSIQLCVTVIRNLYLRFCTKQQILRKSTANPHVSMSVSYSVEPSWAAEQREHVIFSCNRFRSKAVFQGAQNSVLNQNANVAGQNSNLVVGYSLVPVQHSKCDAKCNSNPPTRTPRDQSEELDMIVIHVAGQRIAFGWKIGQTPKPTLLQYIKLSCQS